MPGRHSSTKTSKITDAGDYALTTDVPDPVERFRSVLYTDGGDDIYGVIRMSVLRQIAPFDSYHWADRTFVAELALHGPFHNVPTSSTSGVITRCVPRRWDATTSGAVVLGWIRPGRTVGGILVVRLVGRVLLGYASAIRRAPLSSRGSSALYERASRLDCRQPTDAQGARRRDLTRAAADGAATRPRVSARSHESASLARAAGRRSRSEAASSTSRLLRLSRQWQHR